jgi:hypothetical protein
MFNERTIYKNVSPLARTLSEANRDADYATPIWRCETEQRSGMRLLGYLVGVLGIWLMFGLLAVSFLHWFGFFN